MSLDLNEPRPKHEAPSIPPSNKRGKNGIESPSSQPQSPEPIVQGHLEASLVVEFMQRLQRVKRLQSQATSARLHADQKTTEAENTRQDISDRDADFMTALQRLIAQGRLQGCDELLSLSAECQTARDRLGLITEEEFEERSRWLGKMWKLKVAEESLLEEFNFVFDAAETYSPGPPSVDSRYYESPSEHEAENYQHDLYDGQNETGPHPEQLELSPSDSEPLLPSTEAAVPYQSIGSPENSTITGLTWADPDIAQQARFSQDVVDNYANERGDAVDQAYDSDSRPSANLDRTSEGRPTHLRFKIPESLRTMIPPGIEMYPELLTDFATKRERIKKWLLHSALLSRMDANLLRDRLACENPKSPSNWAQLSIAWLEHDMISSPKVDPNLHCHPVEPTSGSGNRKREALELPNGSRARSPRPRQALRVSMDSDSERCLDTAPGSMFDRSEGVSSHTSFADPLGAANEFATLLLDHDDLKPLFNKSCQTLDTFAFIKNLRALLKILSCDLAGEAGEPSEIAAAHLLRHSRTSVGFGGRSGDLRSRDREKLK
jgi:hypothetical protein